MCCNMDTDCDNRRNVRRFYGCLPHPGPRRSAAKLVLLIASLAQIISKALSVTFLFLMGAFWLIGFMFIDVGLHLLYTLMCAPAPPLPLARRPLAQVCFEVPSQACAGALCVQSTRFHLLDPKQ